VASPNPFARHTGAAVPGGSRSPGAHLGRRAAGTWALLQFAGVVPGRALSPRPDDRGLRRETATALSGT